MREVAVSVLRGACLALLLPCVVACGDDGDGGGGGGDVPTFPVIAEELVSGTFGTSEGITFNGEGRLFVVADAGVHEVDAVGGTTLIASLTRPVGMAGLGATDLLVADFGDEAAPEVIPNDDGSVQRVTPAGEVSTFATGIPDPNFIWVRADGSMLVSDDFADKIYLVSASGETSVFLEGIPFPNGMVESPDGSTLYVAQTFSGLDPLTFDTTLWSVPLTGGTPGTPTIFGSVEGTGANDGLAIDSEGRVYVAANLDGKIWRFEPTGGAPTLIAENLLGVASLVFGEGAFDRQSLYATQLLGGRVWKIPVGATAGPLYR